MASKPDRAAGGALSIVKEPGSEGGPAVWLPRSIQYHTSVWCFDAVLYFKPMAGKPPLGSIFLVTFA